MVGMVLVATLLMRWREILSPFIIDLDSEGLEESIDVMMELLSLEERKALDAPFI